MVAAMKEFKDGKGTVSSAARKHHVPKRSLDDRVKGSVQHGKSLGPSTVLTVGFENFSATLY